MSEPAAALRSAAAPTAPERDLPPWHGEVTAMARRLFQICRVGMNEVVGEAGLTSLQYGAMLYLSKQSGADGVEQNSLAAGMDLDRTSASLLVDQLATKGMIERRVNGADRRARLLKLTPKGEKLRSRLRPAHLAAKDRILAPLTPRERKQFFDLLFRLIRGNLIDRQPGAARRQGRKRRAPSATA